MLDTASRYGGRHADRRENGADHVRVRCEHRPSKGTAIMSKLALVTRYRPG